MAISSAQTTADCKRLTKRRIIVSFEVDTTISESAGSEGGDRDSPASNAENSNEPKPYFVQSLSSVRDQSRSGYDTDQVAQPDYGAHIFSNPFAESVYSSNQSFAHCPYPEPAPRFGQHESQWPLPIFEEAKLFRYYVTDLANWFDYADTQKHFTIVIPELAQSCAALRNAILALSAKQLHLQGKLHESISLRYQDACYNALLSNLHDKAFRPAGLAAGLILRLVLHMTCEYQSIIFARA